MRLPGLPGRLGAAAEFRGPGDLRDPQHPGGLPAQGLGFPVGASRASPDRGDAPCLYRPQQLPRRPRLREEPGRPAARQGLRRQGPQCHRPRQGHALAGVAPRRCAARGQQHHALLDRRPVGQCRLGDLHAQHLVRRACHGSRHRCAAEQRDGRFHGQGRRAEQLRPRAGRGQCDCAGQAAVVVDEPHDCEQGRQAGDGAGHAGRQPDHYGGAAHHPERCGLRHGRSGGGRRAAFSPAVVARGHKF
mmetsp:Transcript_44829/g.105562  ORF Transcript_44829/g.105562 Transcript_44829/m.105562 type:complete len:246 (-) Transcript_44829:2126-2863(-)